MFILSHSIFDLDLSQTIFLLATLLAAVGLIIIIYSRNKESIRSRLFILILLLVIGYLFSHGIHFLIMHSADVTILDNSCHSFLLLIIVAITFFTWNFPASHKIGITRSLLIIVPTVILLTLLWDGFFIQESQAHDQMFEVSYSSAYPLFLLWYAFLIALNFYWLIKKYYNETNDIQRKQILMLFLGLIITNLASFIFGLFMPWYLGFYYLVEISPLAFLAGVILFTTVAVNRYDMFHRQMKRIHNFSISKKIILSSLILVPIIIMLVQIPLIRIIFIPETNRELSRFFFISVLGGLIVSISMAFIIVRIISKPLNMLKNKVHEIETGKYGAQIELNSNDEFGELTEAFNAMSETLRNNSIELQTKENRITLLLNAFDKSSAAIAVVDGNFNILESNPQFLEIVNKNKSNVLRKNIGDVQFADGYLDYFKILKNELQLYSKFRGEITYNNRKLLISVTPSSSRNYSEGYLFIEVDITEQRRLEEQLLMSEKLATLGKMAAVLAHEIKTPLTSIKMNTDIIAESRLARMNDEEKENFEIIQTEINRLNNLVKDVLQLSRQMDLEYSSVNLYNLVENIRLQVNNKLKNKKVILINKADSVELAADVNKLKQVLLNLVDNSIEAISTFGEIKISSDIDDAQNTIKIFIEDNGKGIDSSINIFEPFMTTKSSGTGLGLSIAQKILEQHKGALQLITSEQATSDKPGKTIFEIILPLKR